MNRKLQTVLLGAVLALFTGGACAAEGQSITFDATTDFRALKTFAIGAGHITTLKPEVDNRLFRQRLENSIRATLMSKGLKEVGENPDLSVVYYFTDADYSTVERREPLRVQGSTGNPGFAIPGGPQTVLFTEGTLVIDVGNAANAVIWRGTYHDREISGPTLSRKLSEDARKMLSKFPSTRKNK